MGPNTERDVALLGGEWLLDFRTPVPKTLNRFPFVVGVQSGSALFDAVRDARRSIAVG